MLNTAKENRHLTIISILSVVIPVAVAVLLFSPAKLQVESDWIGFLPHLNAAINTFTAIALMAALVFIKNKQIKYHEAAMYVAFALGAVFLISYVVYHASAASTVFGDINRNGILDENEALAIGSMRSVYLMILLSHIVLAAVVVPFVLLALYFALTGKYGRHRKIVKFAYPIWLYVSITGVVVYLMISPYY